MIKLCYLFNIYIVNKYDMMIKYDKDIKLDGKEDYSLPISLCQGVITIAI